MDAKQFLIRFWIGFSTLGTVISLVSLTDNIIAWAAFIVDLVDAYRQLVDGFWGALFSPLPFNVPRWLHDYATLTSLTSVSVLWAYLRTSSKLGFSSLGSIFGIVKNSVWDLRVVGNMFELARDDINVKTADLQTDADLAALAQFNEISTLKSSYGEISIAIFFTVAIAAIMVVFPFLVVPFIAFVDRRSFRASLKLIDKRTRQFERSAPNAPAKQFALETLAKTRASAKNRKQIDALFHSEVRQQLLYYYAAVALIFATLVFMNYAYGIIADIFSNEQKSSA